MRFSNECMSKNIFIYILLAYKALNCKMLLLYFSCNNLSHDILALAQCTFYISSYASEDVVIILITHNPVFL